MHLDERQAHPVANTVSTYAFETGAHDASGTFQRWYGPHSLRPQPTSHDDPSRWPGVFAAPGPFRRGGKANFRVEKMAYAGLSRRGADGCR